MAVNTVHPEMKPYKVNELDLTPGVAPLHEESNSWTFLLTNDIEFFITDIRPGGAALKDNHPDADHFFYYLSGHGYQILDGERFDYGPGDGIFVPRGVDHEMYPLGQETTHMVVTFSPARQAKQKK